MPTPSPTLLPDDVEVALVGAPITRGGRHHGNTHAPTVMIAERAADLIASPS